jgi:L-threonylcarbamoyladenylate synthase
MTSPIDAASIDQAARCLAAGGLVAFPTETVYGLGADAASAEAVGKIYAVKGRPADHPLIVHVLDEAQGRHWARFDARAERLVRRFWPGPLTLVLPRAEGAPPFACGGQSSIGLRCPSHPVARALMRRFTELGGLGIAAPSANRFGKVSPTRAAHVADDLGVDTPLVLDGGAAEVGVESTILDLTRAAPVLLRPGRVDRERLAEVLGEPVADRDAAAPRASGTLAAHYRPDTRVELVDAAALDARARAIEPARVAAWCPARPMAPVAHWEPAPSDPQAFEAALYDTLRRLDGLGVQVLLVAAPPSGVAWDAVRDRLARAGAAG